MIAINRPYTKIINGTMQFVIPVFQRDYSWTEPQCEQLWNDVLQIATAESDRGHFLGSVVYIATGDSSAGFTRWLLIDGQQRMTTLALLMAALRDHIFEIEWKGDADGPTAKKIDAYFLKNPEEEGDRYHKLVLRRHDQATLRALLDQDELPKDPSERIVENYEFFREQLTDADPAEVYRGIGRLVVVDVTLDRGADDPQQIFESLNSTGMDLSQSDLIRNFILMRLPEKEQTRLYESYWSKIENLFRGSENTFDAFVRDYLAIKTQASKQEKSKEIYQAFRRNFSDLEKESGGLGDFLADMLRFARYHAAFSIGGDSFSGLADDLNRLRRLVDVPAPLVMILFDCYEHAGTLSEKYFQEALQLIESYIFRRAICGEQTRGYWQVFANLAYRIDKQQPLESLRVRLVRQSDSYRFPSNEEFHRELQQRDLYGLRVCSYLLERLENHASKEPTNTNDYSIEHILPQNEKLSPVWQKMLGPNWKMVQETWLHRLGNLTLTGYNSTYSDSPFEKKKTIPGGFEESSVRLNKFVREQLQWTKTEIEKRGKVLADRSLEIWPELQVNAAAIESAKQADLRERAAKRDVGKVQMDVVAHNLFEQLRLCVKRLDAAVLELAEKKSISYHSPGFFLEVLPRKHRLLLLLPLDYNEVVDPTGIAGDATESKFFVNANYEGGVTINIREPVDIENALPIIRQSLNLANS
ncbi:MAG: DUF262 and DUF1524 domain-containing protein [Verrucomicrobia bacterium]|nr:DUF262 and DUF1524 domain-containing protein [Verrucomicrobiota bacterium]